MSAEMAPVASGRVCAGNVAGQQLRRESHEAALGERVHRVRHVDAARHAWIQVEERGRAVRQVERAEQRHHAGAARRERVRVLVVGQLVRVAAALAQLAAAVQTRHPSGGRGGTSFFGRGRGGRGR